MREYRAQSNEHRQCGEKVSCKSTIKVDHHEDDGDRSESTRENHVLRPEQGLDSSDSQTSRGTRSNRVSSLPPPSTSAFSCLHSTPAQDDARSSTRSIHTVHAEIDQDDNCRRRTATARRHRESTCKGMSIDEGIPHHTSCSSSTKLDANIAIAWRMRRPVRTRAGTVRARSRFSTT
jgi:hypothetical protein